MVGLQFWADSAVLVTGAEKFSMVPPVKDVLFLLVMLVMTMFAMTMMMMMQARIIDRRRTNVVIDQILASKDRVC